MTDPAEIASLALDGVGTGLLTGARFAQGPAAVGLGLAGAGVELVALLTRAFGTQAPIKIPRMRDAIKARLEADGRVDAVLLEELGLDMEAP